MPSDLLGWGCQQTCTTLSAVSRHVQHYLCKAPSLHSLQWETSWAQFSDLKVVLSAIWGVPVIQGFPKKLAGTVTGPTGNSSTARLSAGARWSSPGHLTWHKQLCIGSGLSLLFHSCQRQNFYWLSWDPVLLYNEN